MTMTSALNANGAGQILVSGSSINGVNEAEEVINGVKINDRIKLINSSMLPPKGIKSKSAAEKGISVKESIRPAPTPAPRPPIHAPRPSLQSNLPQASNQSEYLDTSHQPNNSSLFTASQESLVEGMLSSDVTNVNEPVIEKPLSTSTAADQNSKNIPRTTSFDMVSIPAPSENTAEKDLSKGDKQQKSFIDAFADLMVGCCTLCFGGMKQPEKLEKAKVVTIEMQAMPNNVESK